VLLLAGLLGWLTKPVVAETNCEGLGGEPLYECLGRQITDLSKALADSKAATAPLESEVNRLEREIASIQRQIGAAEDRLDDLADEIEDREKDLAVQYLLLAEKTKGYYKRMRTSSGAVEWLLAVGSGELQQELGYREVAVNQDRVMIASLAEEIAGLESDRADLEMSKTRLSGLQASLDKEADFFKKEIAGAKEYQMDLQGKIAQLTAKQQAVLAARSGSYITSVGSVPIGSDYDASIAGFEANAPSGTFAVFSFGAYTHRKGMSQYGAKARAETQNHEEILQAYYGKRPVEKDTGGTINVSGYGPLDFENYYLMGIAEMPSDWPMEALKAQAIAARTYAYRVKQEGGTICVTESCQVFSKSKADNPPDAWRQAVEQTRGKVLEDVVTYYSSTAGGYLTTSGWDTEDRSGDGNWTTRAWESKAGSPWFYKAWYRNGYKNSDNDCGRRPWMSEEEMADILNAWLVLKQGEGSGIDTGRILPVTINQCPIGGQVGDPYSMAELRSKLSNPVLDITEEPSVSHDGSGNTTTVVFHTNRGALSIPGYQFKEVFNGRAPGYLSIPQSGFAFFNIESK
jgi:predicted  nucleic acid-binding Zn-ribbon protein